MRSIAYKVRNKSGSGITCLVSYLWSVWGVITKKRRNAILVNIFSLSSKLITFCEKTLTLSSGPQARSFLFTSSELGQNVIGESDESFLRFIFQQRDLVGEGRLRVPMKWIFCNKYKYIFASSVISVFIEKYKWHLLIPWDLSW